MSRTVYNNLQRNNEIQTDSESKSRRLIERPVKIGLLGLCLKEGNEKSRLSPIYFSPLPRVRDPNNGCVRSTTWSAAIGGPQIVRRLPHS